MIDKIKLRWVYLLSLLFILANAFLVYKEQYWGFFIPAGIILILLYIYAIDKVLFLIVFATPLAVLFHDTDLGFAVSMPTEPLLAGLLVMFFLRGLLLHDFDRKVVRHMVSVAILINIIWLFITSITSELPVVSFKYLLSRLWFVIPFFFLGSQLFRQRKNLFNFVWLYTISLIGVIGFTIYNHWQWGFAEDPGHWVMTPFFNDHTSYGAILAMFLPITLGLVFCKNYNKTQRLFSFLVFLIIAIALFLSYSRAAWISVGAVAGLFVLIVFRIRFRVVLLAGVALIAIFIVFQNQIFMKMEKNKQDSSSNIAEHVQSIANISSDASNLERINRWKSAIRMFSERPILGWGPGTYQFLYAPFQNSQERTIISTNAGDKGNAHSEYIGPLAESGVLGLLSFLAVAVLIIFTGIRVYQNAVDKDIKLLSLLFVLSLFSYLVHGFLNNFLDTDKASIPFWGLSAALVAMDLYYPKKSEQEEA